MVSHASVHVSLTFTCVFMHMGFSNSVHFGKLGRNKILHVRLWYACVYGGSGLCGMVLYVCFPRKRDLLCEFHKFYHPELLVWLVQMEQRRGLGKQLDEQEDACKMQCGRLLSDVAITDKCVVFCLWVSAPWLFHGRTRVIVAFGFAMETWARGFMSAWECL